MHYIIFKENTLFIVKEKVIPKMKHSQKDESDIYF